MKSQLFINWITAFTYLFICFSHGCFTLYSMIFLTGTMMTSIIVWGNWAFEHSQEKLHSANPLQDLYYHFRFHCKKKKNFCFTYRSKDPGKGRWVNLPWVRTWGMSWHRGTKRPSPSNQNPEWDCNPQIFPPWPSCSGPWRTLSCCSETYILLPEPPHRNLCGYENGEYKVFS